MLVVHVHVRIRPGRAEDFLAATLANARASLGEPGVLRFDVLRDQADPEHAVLVEVYRDTVAEMMAEPRQSVRFSAVFPVVAEGWASTPP
jgi:(4S)-4-hydroxy-5-phosphonooxypentane-2,3-dione isomerase